MNELQSILLYDGECNLCNHWVQFVLANEERANIYFAALQSDLGRRLLTEYSLDTGQLDSVVFVENGTADVKSGAVFRIVRYLKLPWRWLAVFRLMPRTITDWAYDIVARNRYRLFGRQKICKLPDPKLQSRFLG